MVAQIVRQTIRRAEAEREAGRAWRAKEILRGSLRHPQFALEPEFLRAYGELLDQLGDRLEAGKYLFLSGHRDQAHEAAIALYLERNRRNAIEALVSRFPAAIRYHGLGHLPERVRAELASLGAPEEVLARREPPSVETEPMSLRDRLEIMLILAIVLAIGLCAVIGCFTLVRWGLVRLAS